MHLETKARRDIQVVANEADVRRCWPTFHELRPHLRSETEFVERWRKQSAEGYQIVYVTEGGAVAAAAGYRFFNTMAWGHILYIDDLVALPILRGKGLGTLLLQYVQAEARRAGCDSIQLDTGYQRHSAHLAYLRNGFRIDCHHMAWLVDRDGFDHRGDHHVAA